MVLEGKTTGLEGTSSRLPHPRLSTFLATPHLSCITFIHVRVLGRGRGEREGRGVVGGCIGGGKGGRVCQLQKYKRGEEALNRHLLYADPSKDS